MAERRDLAHGLGEALERRLDAVGRRARGRSASGGSARRRGRRGADRRIDRSALGAHRLHPLEGEPEAAQARFDAPVGLADRRLARGPRERQQPAAGDRAEQHRADHGAGLLRDRRHVEDLRLAAVRTHDVEQRLDRGAAVAELHLLGGRQRAARRADHVGALARRHAVADLAHRLEQLGGHQQVDRAGHRVQAEHRAAAAEFGVGPRKDFDVVGGRAGALRDAGDRRALHRVAARDRGLDQPFGEHAAAFAAEGAEQHGDRLHAGLSSRSIGARKAAARRSCHFGFCTTSPR